MTLCNVLNYLSPLPPVRLLNSQHNPRQVQAKASFLRLCSI